MRRAWPTTDVPRSSQPHKVLVLTSAQSREVDRLALEEFGLPTLVLMENAARAVADAALSAVAPGDPVIVLAGPGNNGGDALAAARHLHNAGILVEVMLAYPAALCKGDCALHLRVVEEMGVPVKVWDATDALAGDAPPALIVDGVFGTGLARALDARTSELVRAVNAARERGSRVLAVDVPTGMDADTGHAISGGEVVRADATVTFAAMKPGLMAPGAPTVAGRVIVADIGVPKGLVERVAHGP